MSPITHEATVRTENNQKMVFGCPRHHTVESKILIINRAKGAIKINPFLEALPFDWAGTKVMSFLSLRI
jgi:hypothetical protein